MSARVGLLSGVLWDVRLLGAEPPPPAASRAAAAAAAAAGRAATVRGPAAAKAASPPSRPPVRPPRPRLPRGTPCTGWRRREAGARRGCKRGWGGREAATRTAGWPEPPAPAPTGDARPAARPEPEPGRAPRRAAGGTMGRSPRPPCAPDRASPQRGPRAALRCQPETVAERAGA